MTHPAFPPPAAPPLAAPRPAVRREARAHADYRWTPAKAKAFLDCLARCGKVAEAARHVGMTRQSAYRLKARSAVFADLWPRALAAGQQRRKVTVPRVQGDGFGAPR